MLPCPPGRGVFLPPPPGNAPPAQFMPYHDPPHQGSPTGFAAIQASLWEGGGFATRRRRRESNQRPYFSPTGFAAIQASLWEGGGFATRRSRRERKQEIFSPHVGACCRARRIFNLNDCRWQSLRFLISRPPAQIPTAGNGRQIASPTVGTFKVKKVHDVIGKLPFYAMD